VNARWTGRSSFQTYSDRDAQRTTTIVLPGRWPGLTTMPKEERPIPIGQLMTHRRFPICAHREAICSTSKINLASETLSRTGSTISQGHYHNRRYSRTGSAGGEVQLTGKKWRNKRKLLSRGSLVSNRALPRDVPERSRDSSFDLEGTRSRGRLRSVTRERFVLN